MRLKNRKKFKQLEKRFRKPVPTSKHTFKPRQRSMLTTKKKTNKQTILFPAQLREPESRAQTALHLPSRDVNPSSQIMSMKMSHEILASTTTDRRHKNVNVSQNKIKVLQVFKKSTHKHTSQASSASKQSVLKRQMSLVLLETGRTLLPMGVCLYVRHQLS